MTIPFTEQPSCSNPSNASQHWLCQRKHSACRWTNRHFETTKDRFIIKWKCDLSEDGLGLSKHQRRYHSIDFLRELEIISCKQSMICCWYSWLWQPLMTGPGLFVGARNSSGVGLQNTSTVSQCLIIRCSMFQDVEDEVQENWWHCCTVYNVTGMVACSIPVSIILMHSLWSGELC